MNSYHQLHEEISSFLNCLLTFESGFGATAAIAKYGQAFQPHQTRANWLQFGRPRDCFNNATSYALARSNVHYAEGYALSPDLPIPVQHAWLVDADGRVADATWGETQGHVYFGIAFRREFIVDMLTSADGQAGVLVNMHLLRKRFPFPGQLEVAIRDGRLPIPAPNAGSIRH